MKLPSTLINQTDWVFVGPMGPALSSEFSNVPIIGIDGGAYHTSRMDIWVGDADSFKEEVHADQVFKQPVEKDQSDLGVAFNLFRDFRHYKFHMWGFLGGRKDHELFNLGETMLFLEQHQESQAIFYNDEGKISFHALGAGHWKFTHMGLFSLGTLKKTQVRLVGDCDYPISKLTTVMPLSSFGLSNIATGEIVIETLGPIFIYFPEGK